MATNDAPSRRVLKRKTRDTEDVRESVLSKVKGGAVSAIVGVGNALGLPGSMIRDTLALENPFDQLLSPLSDTNRISGRDLLTKYGVTSKNKSTGLFGSGGGEFAQDVAGFVGELALDPLSYLTTGVSGAGKLASKAGLAKRVGQSASKRGIATPLGAGNRAARAGSTLRNLLDEGSDNLKMMDDLVTANGGQALTDDVLDEALGGTVGLALPFERDARMVFNNDSVNKVLDKASGAIRGSGPVRVAKQLFGGRHKGAGTELGQDLGSAGYDIAKQADSEAQMFAMSIADELKATGFYDEFTDPVEARAMSYDFTEGMKEVPEKYKGVFQRIKDWNQSNFERKQAQGLAIDPLKDKYIEPGSYAPRNAIRPLDEKYNDFAKGRFTDTKDPTNLARSGLRKDIPEGTGGLIRMSEEFKRVASKWIDKPKLAMRWLERNYGPKIPGGFNPIRKMVHDAVGHVRKGLDEFATEDALKSSHLGKTPDWLTEDIAKTVHKLKAELPEGTRLTDAVHKELSEEAIVRKISQRITASVAKGSKPKEAIRDALGNSQMEAFTKLWSETFEDVKQQLTKQYADDVKGTKYKPRKPSMKDLVEIATSKANEAIPITPEVAKKLGNRLAKLRRTTSDLSAAYQPDATLLKKLEDTLSEVLKTAGDDPATFAEKASTGLQKALAARLPDEFKYATKKGIKEGWNRRGKLGRDWIVKTASGAMEQGEYSDLPTAMYRSAKYGLEKERLAKLHLDAIADLNVRQKAQAAGSDGTVQLGPVLKKLGFKTDPQSFNSVMASLAERMGYGPRVEFAGKSLGELDPDELARVLEAAGDVNSIQIDKQWADDLLRINKRISGPEPLSKLQENVQWVTNLIKANFTAPWANFHVRNRMSGSIRNMLRGMFNKKDTANASALFAGKTVKGALKRYPILAQEVATRGLPATDESATQVLREMLHSYSMTGDGQGQWIGKETQTITDIDEAMKQLPGSVPREPYKDFAKGWASLLPKKVNNTFRLPDVSQDVLTEHASKASKGFVGKMTKPSRVNPLSEEFGPFRGGAALGQQVEGLNRSEAFLNLLSKGTEPGEAARIVMEAHVDYGNSAYSAFEKQVASQAYPFWKFLSRNTAGVAKELAQHPGGGTAQLARGLAYGHDPDELTPEHIANTAAIPLDILEDGTKRYLTGLGTMEESAFNFLNPNVRSSARSAMSNLNPLVKWIPEWAAGEAFFQAGADGSGRDLVDMDPLLGRIGANVANVTGLSDRKHPYRLGQGLEYAVGNSPASRALHTIRQVTDKRKGWTEAGINTLTGLRVTDVSEKAQTDVLRDAVQTLMRESGGRSFSGMYYPADMELSPEQEQFQQILDELNLKSRANRKERKPSKAK